MFEMVSFGYIYSNRVWDCQNELKSFFIMHGVFLMVHLFS